MRILSCLFFIIVAFQKDVYNGSACDQQIKKADAITRGDVSQKKIALVLTGDEFGDGGEFIATALKTGHVKASFF